MENLRPVKTAVVGCGMISNIYIKNLKNLFSIIDLVACCDINMDNARAQAEKYGVENVMTLEEVLKSDEIELAINLTGPAQHYEVVKQLLEAGKHVWTEKVLCLDIEEGKELVALAKEKNVYLGVAPDTFLGAGLQTARWAIDKGMIGDVTSVLAVVNRNQAIASEFFGFIRFAGGGFPYDVGVYYVTAMLALLGPVKRITGFSKNIFPVRESTLFYNGRYGQKWEFESRNLMAGALEFESGAVGSMLFAGESIQDEQPHFAIYGTEGILYLGNPGDFHGSVKLLRKGCGNGAVDKAIELPFTHGFKDTPVGGEPGPFDWGQQRGVGAAEMAWSIRKGRPHRASAEMGLHTLEVLAGMDISSDSGKIYEMTTTFEKPRALPSGYLAFEAQNPMFKMDSEVSLAL